MPFVHIFIVLFMVNVLYSAFAKTIGFGGKNERYAQYTYIFILIYDGRTL